MNAVKKVGFLKELHREVEFLSLAMLLAKAILYYCERLVCHTKHLNEGDVI